MSSMLFVFFIYLVNCLDDPIHTAILYGNSDQGYYFVNLLMGKHRQKQSVIVDTGSSITAFPCSDCQTCGKHEDAYYEYRNSSFHKNVKCGEKIGEKQCFQCSNSKCSFHIGYAEGSVLSGYYSQDMMLLGDEFLEISGERDTSLIIENEQVFGVFGCTTTMTNLFFDQKANGIMGLSPKTNTDESFPNYIDDLYRKESQTGISKLFTLCLGRQDGYMSAGQFDYNRHSANSSYHRVKYYRDRADTYRIVINSIKVNNSVIVTSTEIDKGQGAFIDSGSTLVNTHQKLSEQLVSQFKCLNESCPEIQYFEGLECYQYQEEQHGSFSKFASYFPTYTFELENNFTFLWKPINYLTLAAQTTDMYCFPVYVYPGTPRLILGQVWMRNWDIAFNKSSEELIFVEANCSSSKVNHSFSEEEIIKLEQGNPRFHNKRRQYTDVVERKKISKLIMYSIFSFLIIGLTFFGFYRYLLYAKRNSYKVIDTKDGGYVE